MNIKEYTATVIKNGKSARAEVHGTTRGGYVYNDSFFFCGSVAMGIVENSLDSVNNLEILCA